jgi:hypothetical protein
MSLSRERLHILKGLSGDAYSSLVFEQSLATTVRALLIKFESVDEAARIAAVDKLMMIYEEYGPVTWRCVLEFSFLLYTTIDLDSLFAPLFDNLERDIKVQPELASDVVNEINWFARSPYDVTEKLVSLTLSRLSTSSNILADLVANQEADRLLRLAAAKAAISTRSQSTYPSIVRFFREVSKEKSVESFRRIVLPLAEAFANTGTAGLLFAVQSFESNELGPHGPLLLSLFRSDFAAWFLAHPPRPSRRWASVLLMSWHKVKEATYRNGLLGTLIDDWCTNTKVASFVRRKLREELRENDSYLAPANVHLKARAVTFAVPESGSGGSTDEIMQLLRLSDEEWNRKKGLITLDRVTGRIAAQAMTKLSPNSYPRILAWVEQNQHNVRFQRQFFAELIRPTIFRLLLPEWQLAVLRSKSFANHVTTRELDSLLLGNLVNDEEVRTQLKDLIVLILQKAKLSMPEIGG